MDSAIAVLASDAERDVVIGVLQQAHVEGRLTALEFRERLDRAATARTGETWRRC